MNHKKDRLDLAGRLTAGVGGWFQMLAAQDLEDEISEDSALLTTVQIINAQNAFRPITSVAPPNWQDTQRRIDLAIAARSQSATTWYGALEIKWAGFSFDPTKSRPQIVEDSARLAFIETNLMNAHFLLLGGTTPGLEKLFDRVHPESDTLEKQRATFHSFFSRDLDDATKELNNSELKSVFPKYLSRVEESVCKGFQGKLKTELLSKFDVVRGVKTVGAVYLWQCNRVKGAKTNKL